MKKQVRVITIALLFIALFFAASCATVKKSSRRILPRGRSNDGFVDRQIRKLCARHYAG